MRLFNSAGSNPRVVRIFLHEKGIEIPRVEIDLRAGENRREPYLSINPRGQCPALQLDDGTVVTEITAICEYLDETGSGPSLIGDTARERAVTRMWVRRIDQNILAPMTFGYQYAEGLERFRDRIHVIPQAADDLKQVAREGLAWLDGQMAGRAHVCGARFTLADIMLFAFVEGHSRVGQPVDPALLNVGRILDNARARPSSAA